MHKPGLLLPAVHQAEHAHVHTLRHAAPQAAHGPPALLPTPEVHPTTQVPTSADHCSARPPGGDELQTTRPTEQSETGNPGPITSYQPRCAHCRDPHNRGITGTQRPSHNAHWTHTPHRRIHAPKRHTTETSTKTHTSQTYRSHSIPHTLLHTAQTHTTHFPKRLSTLVPQKR